MFEKVNPSHPDKLADRIAGALVDMAYERDERPRIAVEVLLGHGNCHIIAETSVSVADAVDGIVHRIAGDDIVVDYDENQQDPILALNQSEEIRCGDNGIFKGCPVTAEQRKLSDLMQHLYLLHPYDGKAVLDGDCLTLCQSNVDTKELKTELQSYDQFLTLIVNPLGDWTGGTDVDCGATNRKLGSDMGDAVTGGGTCGKDCSKADVSVNIYAHEMAQERGCIVKAWCSIGDSEVCFECEDGAIEIVPFKNVVDTALTVVRKMGGFEKFAEWGLV